jgi:N-acetylneuraminic acid mutarotase
VTASNGKIYVIGGYDSSQLDTVQEYDPATDTWATRSSMPTARAGMAVAAASNGKIYVFGGISGSSYVATVEEYDPVTDSWATRASMPAARGYAGAAQASNGKIYVIGGRDKTTGTFPAVDTVEEYDPTTDTWTARAGMSLPRYELGVVAANNGRIYAIGGRDYIWFGGYTFYAEFGTVEEYDPVTDTWIRRADMPTARAGLGVAQASNGRIYAIGGSDIGFSSTMYYDTVQEYTLPTYEGGASISKMVTPQGQVEYGDELAYTLVISATPGTQVGLYDPLADTTFARFIEQPQGVVHSGGVITGTLTITPTNQIIVSFGVRVDVPAMAGEVVIVTNRACVYLVGETLDNCVWSNEVENPASRPHRLYLPVVLRDG